MVGTLAKWPLEDSPWPPTRGHHLSPTPRRATCFSLSILPSSSGCCHGLWNISQNCLADHLIFGLPGSSVSTTKSALKASITTKTSRPTCQSFQNELFVCLCLIFSLFAAMLEVVVAGNQHPEKGKSKNKLKNWKVDAIFATLLNLWYMVTCTEAVIGK